MDQATVEIATPTTPAYGTVAKWFHWITAGLLAVALPIGPIIHHIKDADQGLFYSIHESAGLTILLVVVARLAWRQFDPPPPAPHIPRAMHRAANIVHLALYTLLIVQPVLGFLATNAQGFPLQGDSAYLGFIDFPKFTEANQSVGDGLLAAHGIVGWAILALLVLHVGAVVFHQAIRRDNTLLRMV